jgi:hypothetical protein
MAVDAMTLSGRLCDTLDRPLLGADTKHKRMASGRFYSAVICVI